MTLLEAIERVECLLLELGLKDPYGEPLMAIEAVGPVANFHSKEWDDLLDAMESGSVTPDEYASRAGAMVEAFACALFRDRLERKLASWAVANG